ncbi:hypothetical protein [Paenibacillus sp. SN-8-1]|uniref:hypothetical protein n=1 Tax=Paenibacillus sp. SN-8-1 TaxID=3435409 RepID=UPI003D9A1104
MEDAIVAKFGLIARTINGKEVLKKGQAVNFWSTGNTPKPQPVDNISIQLSTNDGHKVDLLLLHSK